jgi:hypothetical protein
MIRVTELVLLESNARVRAADGVPLKVEADQPMAMLA